MKVFTVDGEQLAAIEMKAQGNTLEPIIKTNGMTINGPAVELSTGKHEDGLLVHVVVPGKAKMDIVMEKADVKALKGLMSRDAIGFFLKALM